MGYIAERAERIASALVPPTVGATAVRQPHGAPLDFSLEWPDGHRGVLEVTIVAHPEAIQWQDQLAIAGGKWDVPGKWELRLSTLAMPYRPTEQASRAVVALCDAHDVDGPESLPAEVRASEPAVATVEALGELRRVRVGGEGLHVYVPLRAEFVEATSPDFADLLEQWLTLDHVRGHVAKTAGAPGQSHLFLVPLDDVLPSRFFTDDFEPPARVPAGYEALDGLWIWSNYWHRFLGLHACEWAWQAFPARS